jgi:hypothetical protein
MFVSNNKPAPWPNGNNGKFRSFVFLGLLDHVRHRVPVMM